MKKTRKILYSVLIILTIVTLFLPIATSVDNRIEAVEAQIRKEEGGMTRAVDKLTRENDKVTKAAKDAVVVTAEDEALLAEIDAAGKQVTELEAQIKALNVFLKAAEDAADVEDLDVNEAVAAAKEQKEVLEPELAKAKEAKAALDKKYAAVQAERDFIKPVELVDENGKLIALKDVLQAELDANPDVFASRTEDEVAAFNTWKATLDAKRAELDEDKAGSKLYDENGMLRAEFAAEDAVLTEDEQYLVTSLEESDERYTVMIMIVREQAAVNEMAADPAADEKVLKNLQKALDGVYKQIVKVNKEQDNVNAVRTEGEEMLAADPIDPIVYSLLPNRLPIMDNYTGIISEDITEAEKSIKALEAEIAAMDEMLANATEDGVKAIEDEKLAAEEKLAALVLEAETLTAEQAAADEALAAYETGKPAATEDENAAIQAIEAQDAAVAKLNSDVEKLDAVIAAAQDLQAKDEESADVLNAVITSGNQVKEMIAAKIAKIETEKAEQKKNLADYDARVQTYEAALAEYTKPAEEAKKLAEDKQAEVAETEAAIAKAAELLAQITGDQLTANQKKREELAQKLDAENAELASLQEKLANHKADLEKATGVVKVDMETVNTWGALFPTTFGDLNVAAWLAFAMLVLALVLVWLPGNKLVSKFYTFASFANLIAVIVMVYALLRLMAIPVAQPYGNPIIKAYVALPMIFLPLIALLLHSSGVTNTKRTMIYVLCIALCVLSLLPFWLMIVNATRSTQEIQQGVSLVPSKFLENNWKILQAKHFDVLLGFKNSAIIAFGSTFLSVYFSALTAYGLTVYRFKGAKFLYAVILAIIMIPGQVTGTGFFMFMYQLEWTNSYLPLIIPAIASASTVFFFKQYLEANFQVSLVEAARIDGAGEFYTYNRIVLPIMVPAMATMGIMAVIGSWNNYLTPLMLLSKAEMKTLPMMVKELRGDIYRTEYGSIYLGLTLTAMPLLIVYFLFSKYIIAGVAVGGVKE